MGQVVAGRSTADLVVAGIGVVAAIGAAISVAGPPPASVGTTGFTSSNGSSSGGGNVSGSSSAGSAATSSRPTTTSSKTPGPTSSPSTNAVADLTSLAASDRSKITLNGATWVAQLASKYEGVTDQLQTTSSGSHTFGSADILAEHLALRSRVASATVVLVDSRTYGKRRTEGGKPLWVTMATSTRFTSSDAIKGWCAATFPELSGEALKNQCMPVRP